MYELGTESPLHMHVVSYHYSGHCTAHVYGICCYQQ